MKKANWSRFWNFFIQFFVVVLGVFITLWVGNIAEQSKLNRKTKQGLEMMREELRDYNQWAKRKLTEIEQESEIYSHISSFVAGERAMPSVDTLLHYMGIFQRHRFQHRYHISFESAKESGTLGNIKDLSLLESIHNSYLCTSIMYDMLNELDIYKTDRIINSITITNRDFIRTNGEEELSPEGAKVLWKEITTNDELFRAVIKLKMQLTMLPLTASNCIHITDITINEIENYIK